MLVMITTETCDWRMACAVRPAGVRQACRVREMRFGRQVLGDMRKVSVVREEGLEPSRSYRTQEPESCASANSATRARVVLA